MTGFLLSDYLIDINHIIQPDKMDNTLSIFFSDLLKSFKEYLELKYKYTKLDITEKLLLIASCMAVFLISFTVLVIVIIFTSISLAFYLSETLQSNYLGFITVGAIHFVLLLIILIFKKALIINPIHKSILKRIYKAQKSAQRN